GILILFNCKNDPNKKKPNAIDGKQLDLKYATGFSVTDYGTYKILEIKNPWPKAEKQYRFALLNADYNPVFWEKEQGYFDATINLPIKKIVVTSTTHIPALELL